MPTGQLRGEIDVFKLGLLLRRSGLTPRGITMKYRPEIDGLRAVAVLPIIFFHAGFTWMSGGFVGVDVFFVISGYLITTIILNELDEGRSGFVPRAGLLRASCHLASVAGSVDRVFQKPCQCYLLPFERLFSRADQLLRQIIGGRATTAYLEPGG